MTPRAGRPAESLRSRHPSQPVGASSVLGLVLASKEAVKHFEPDGGSVVNVSSVASVSAPPNAAAVYSATKAAVDAVTRSLARERLPLSG